MDSNAWITFVGIVSAAVVGLLGMIVKGTWTISSTLTGVTYELSGIEKKLTSVCDSVDSAHRELGVATRTLHDHTEACDADRKALHDKIAAVT